MAAVTAGVAAAGVLASAYAANQASRQAGRATDAQREAAMNDLAFRQQQYNRYLGLMGPIEDKLAEEAKSTEPLDYGRNAAQIKRSYADALRNISTSAGMRGIAGGGLDRGAMRGAAFQQAGDLSGAYSKGLTDRRNLGLTLTGRGQIGQAAQGVQGGMQNLSNFYGGQAGLYNQAAGQGWQDFGQGLQSLAQMYGQYNAPATTTTSANIPLDQLNQINTTNTSGLPASWEPDAWR